MRTTRGVCIVAAAAALLAACDGEKRCAGPALRQPTHRFPAGWTAALPAIDRERDGCAEARWELTEAPAASRNELVGDDAARFTPDVPGVYGFRIAATGEALHLTSIEDAAPFQQFNYYPGNSIAMVAGVPWTADVYRATVTALEPDGARSIPVGPWPVAIAWRPGMPYAVVAQRASDDLGLVDVAAHRLVDAIPVGDEPASVVVSPDGATAYVALAVSGDVAVVDLASRALVARIPLAPDVRALALSPDGRRLYAARLRSRQPARAPFPDTPVADERDLFIVDVATREVVREVLDVGATIRHLAVSDDGAVLYVSRIRNDTYGNIADGKAHFVDEIARLDAVTGAPLAAVDVGRQATAAGFAVTAQGFTIVDGRLWLAAEGSDVAVALDATTLAEVARVPAPGRPRSVISDGHRVYVHGPQGFVVTAIDATALPAIATTVSTGADPRPATVARGQQLFTGAGKTYGADHACHSCHAEGLTDGLVWKVGPVDEYATPRPLFWLEGTAPLGWPGYLSDVRNWGYEGGSTTGVRPTTAEAEDLGAYLASVMPPPPANDDTERDGELSAQARRGQQVFEGTGGCIECHRPPLFTIRRTLAQGVTPGKSDIPSLVGAYRHGVWFKNGEARSIDEAAARMAAFVEAELGDDQLADLGRYLRELTGRDFFVLTSDPEPGARHIGADRPLRLTFSLPVWTAAENLARLQLVDDDGGAVRVTVVATGRHVALTPAAPLKPGHRYHLKLDGLESFDERRAEATTIDFTVAAAPTLAMTGDYTWTFAMPVFDPRAGGFDPTRTMPLVVPVHAGATASGVELTFDLGAGLTYTRHAVIDGDTLHLPAVPVPVGPTLADSRLDAAALVDDDGDGRADRADGTLRFTGPGFDLTSLRWTIAPR